MRSRRKFLGQTSAAMGAMALGGLLPAKPPDLSKAKAVIWLFMEGGPSHLDLFDPKPALAKLAGQPMPLSFGRPVTAMGTAHNPLMPSRSAFKRYGQSGLWFSDWYENLAQHADNMAVIRSCWADGLNHVGSVCQMNTGSILAGQPALGAWIAHGLASASKAFRPFVVLTDAQHIAGGPRNWSSGFLPDTCEGACFHNGYDAFAGESKATQKLYGLDDPLTAKFGANCLAARQLVERGVRFVEIYCSGWDAHHDLEANHSRMCRISDQPVAGLLTDLKGRGLFESTLVIWGGEFGRTPFCDKSTGRDHNPSAFTMWMAGGGVRGGQAIGATDEIGLRAVGRPCHVHDIHASILHLLGLDHLRTSGEVIREMTL